MNKVCIIAVCLFFPSIAVSMSGDVVYDPTNYANAVEILNQTKEQIRSINAMKSELQTELSNVQSILGNPTLDSNNAISKNWSEYVKCFVPNGIDKNSILNVFGFDKQSSNYNNIEQSRQFIEKQFFPVDMTTSNWADRDLTRKNREKASHNSTLTGIAISSKSKHSLNKSHENIANVVSEGARSTDLLSSLKVNNQLLSMIATELIQQRELMAHLLEMHSVQQAKEMGSIDISNQKLWK